MMTLLQYLKIPNTHSSPAGNKWHRDHRSSSRSVNWHLSPLIVTINDTEPIANPRPRGFTSAHLWQMLHFNTINMLSNMSSTYWMLVSLMLPDRTLGHLATFYDAIWRHKAAMSINKVFSKWSIMPKRFNLWSWHIVAWWWHMVPHIFIITGSREVISRTNADVSIWDPRNTIQWECNQTRNISFKKYIWNVICLPKQL